MKVWGLSSIAPSRRRSAPSQATPWKRFARAEAMALGDRVHRHEADVVAVAGIAARDCRGRRRAAWRRFPRESGGDRLVSRPCTAAAPPPSAGTARAAAARAAGRPGRRALLLGRQPGLAAGAAAPGRPRFLEAGRRDDRGDVKSRSVITGRHPSGSVIAEMCSESSMSRPVEVGRDAVRDVVGRARASRPSGARC